jgi:flavin-dependent dehydrogenase
MLQEFVDVLIIGAGPSGCVSASYLHKKGVKIKVVEKTKFPRFEKDQVMYPFVQKVKDYLINN